MTARSPQRQRLIEQLSPVVEALGYDLEDLSVSAAGRRSLIRIIVDGDDGIDLDAVAVVSRAISDVLDDDSEGAAFAGPFVLEVSSPGVDRLLTEPRHWRRSIGRLVTADLDGVATTGRVIGVTEAGIELEVGGTTSVHGFAAVGPGKVQVEFSRPGQADLEDDLEEADLEDDDLTDEDIDDDTEEA